VLGKLRECLDTMNKTNKKVYRLSVSYVILMSVAEELMERLEESIHDGPFGPVEFKAYIDENEQDYDLFISHLKVHEGYRRQGLGREAIQNAARICSESNLPVQSVSIDILNESGAEDFLKDVGFNNVKKHGNQVSGQSKIEELL